MIKLNCVGLPDQKSYNIILNTMKCLSDKTGSKKALRFPPHFSIRNDFCIKKKNINNLKREMKNYLDKITKMKLQISKYGFYPWKIVYLDIKTTPDLQSLHNETMKIIEQYREPWVPETLLKSPHFKGKQKKYIDEYGYQFSFEFYSPHFTVCGNDMSEENFKKLNNELTNPPLKEVVIEKVAFMDRDNHNDFFYEVNLK